MSIEKIELTKPLLINGVNRKELTYDIYKLTVNDVAMAETYKIKMMNGGSVGSGIAQTDYLLHICLGMQAVVAVNNDITFEDLMRIEGYDLVLLGAAGQRFFIKPEESDQNISEKPQEDMQQDITVQSKSATKSRS